MRKIKSIVASSHIDRHNECITVDALESMVEQAKEKIIPVFVEHDYRNPPIGRAVDAALIRGEDGNFYVLADYEYFDIEDIGSLETSDHELVIHEYNSEHFQVEYDYSYRDTEYMGLINQLQEIIDPEIKPQEYGKKALEPISWLTIGGAFVLGALTSGFFNKMGADGWDKLKGILSKICNKRKSEQKEYVISFNLTIETKIGRVECSINYTNPTKEIIEQSLKKAFEFAETRLKDFVDLEKPIRRIVINERDGSLQFSYAVGKNGIPLEVSDIENYRQIIQKTNKSES